MTDLTRLELPDGAWATFRTRYGWGPSIRIQSTLLDGDGSEAFLRALVRETVTGWHLPTDTGGWQDFAATAENPALTDVQMDTVDAMAGDAVLARCNAIWSAWRKGRPDPKGSAASSTGTPEASPSE